MQVVGTMASGVRCHGTKIIGAPVCDGGRFVLAKKEKRGEWKGQDG